ncbi:hypothetical protein FRC04_000924 [Tulasnella sp. 424]|nr:hypothetical protein FRC04_000924 [Tulasnella sp. 424]KAG8977840.1 hypothetical protein FRC05_000368 [Tulasnella sp. 425]
MSSFASSAVKLPDNGFAYVTKAKKKRKGSAKRLVPGQRLDFQAVLTSLQRQTFEVSKSIGPPSNGATVLFWGTGSHPLPQTLITYNQSQTAGPEYSAVLDIVSQENLREEYCSIV